MPIINSWPARTTGFAHRATLLRSSTGSDTGLSWRVGNSRIFLQRRVWRPQKRLTVPDLLGQMSFLSLRIVHGWTTHIIAQSSLSLPTPVPVTVPPLPAPSAAQQEPSRGSRQVFPARDLVGSDITRLSGISQTECEALCINNDTCKGYTYDNWNRMCITKNGVSNFRIEPRSTAVIFSGQVPSLSTAAVVMVKRRDREFRDASYASKLTSDYDSCANSCLRDDRCLGVNFNQSSGSCQFFAAPSEYVPVSGIMLGYKYQPAN